MVRWRRCGTCSPVSTTGTSMSRTFRPIPLISTTCSSPSPDTGLRCRGHGGDHLRGERLGYLAAPQPPASVALPVDDRAPGRHAHRAYLLVRLRLRGPVGP